MSERSPGVAPDARTDRIGHEVVELREAGYPCTLLREADGETYQLRVPLKRVTALQGQQPFTVIITLDSSFPRVRPVVVVMALTDVNDDDGEPYQVAVRVRSRALTHWRAGTQLTAIVREIDAAIQEDDLEIDDDPGVAPSAVHAPRSASMQTASAMPAQGRFSRLGRILLVLGLLVLVGALGYAVFLTFSDPCRADLNYVREQILLGDLVSLERAVNRLETIYQRGEVGVGGSCASLRADPALLRTTYLEYGTRLEAVGKLEDASQAYLRGADYGSEEAASSLRTLTNGLWTTAEDQAALQTVEGWGQAVATLERLRTIDTGIGSETFRPGVLPISATLRIAQLRVEWGNALYATAGSEQPLPAARAEFELAKTQFDAATMLVPTPPIGPDAQRRSLWTQRAIILRDTGSRDALQGLVFELEQSREQADPFGQSLDQWRYDAYVAAANQLLTNAVDVEDRAERRRLWLESLRLIEKALDPQIEAASTDAAAAARTRVFELLREQSAYTIGAPETTTPTAFQQRLTEHGFALSDSQKEGLNLIVLYPEQLDLRLLVSSATDKQVAVVAVLGTNAETAELTPGMYRLAVSEHEKEYNFVNLDVKPTEFYVVRVTPRR
jgi:tetratricopeptide (TPR) repeat protein